MKKAGILLTILLSSSLAIFAQTDAMTTLFSAYANDARFVKVNVSSKMFELFSNVEGDTPEEQEFLKTVQNLTGLKVLTMENNSQAKELYRQSLKKVLSPYEQLMSIEDKSEQITFFIKEKNGVISELLMLSGGESSFVILSLSGKIDLQQVKKLSKQMSIGGMDKLNKIK
jgi:hypothetical protein